MSYQLANGRSIVWLTLLAGLLFQIMPVPTAVEAWRPDWLLLVMAYWAMALPHRYNILTAWLFGVMLDVLLGATLGVRALALSIVIYVVVLHFQRLRNFPRWQQSLIVAALVCLYHMVIFWVEAVLGNGQFSIALFLPALSSLAIWFWAFGILRRIRRHYKIR
jgi:rod shape-determining protein MreD